MPLISSCYGKNTLSFTPPVGIRLFPLFLSLQSRPQRTPFVFPAHSDAFLSVQSSSRGRISESESVLSLYFNKNFQIGFYNVLKPHSAPTKRAGELMSPHNSTVLDIIHLNFAPIWWVGNCLVLLERLFSFLRFSLFSLTIHHFFLENCPFVSLTCFFFLIILFL